MEHSQAVMEDAGKSLAAGEREAAKRTGDTVDSAAEGKRHHDARHGKKRAGDWASDRQQYGSRGGGDGRGGRHDGKRAKKGDMGRAAYFASNPDRRQKTTESREKRDRDGAASGSSGNYGVAYSKEEIEAEARKPKRKVAVLIGYAGTGYKGMQITPTEKTIEGDLFAAFIRAGAISKANADDPKKAGLVRCARTDKGVHAAGNMISLKLIVEEPDVVERINAELSPQIRVWGIERTIGSFSCYQACDSRWYEYLIPTHAFLPPHPSSFLAKYLEEAADETGDRKGYEERQAEVMGFWEKVDEELIKPLLESIDEDIRWDVVRALQGEDEADAKAAKAEADEDGVVRAGKAAGKKVARDEGEGGDDEKTEEAAVIIKPRPAPDLAVGAEQNHEGGAVAAPKEDTVPIVEAMVDSAVSLPPSSAAKTDPGATDVRNEQAESGAEAVEHAPADAPPAATVTDATSAADSSTTRQTLPPAEYDRQLRLRAAAKQLRLAYSTAKRRYRIPQSRIERIQTALNHYVGTNNYHNYTIQKTHRDPSSKRHIKSFVVNPQPILIGGGKDDAEKSEWLSLKVHGQSFMMHQIRKMVGMVALLVRCGSDIEKTMSHSFGPDKYSIPKVPGLGLLLERPVFDSYNKIQAVQHQREPLLFSKYEKEMEEFKQREIYERIFREEEERGEFGRFFSHIDNFREPYFLWVSSKGLEACGGKSGREVD